MRLARASSFLLLSLSGFLMVSYRPQEGRKKFYKKRKESVAVAAAVRSLNDADDLAESRMLPRIFTNRKLT